MNSQKQTAEEALAELKSKFLPKNKIQDDDESSEIELSEEELRLEIMKSLSLMAQPGTPYLI